ncbi:MAG: hypothetical protein PHW89_02200 [Sulfurimonas denitrificans]|nr:hypothetical protein [Sulfurimonas denitrificans]
MKKIVSIAVVTIAALTLMSGCSATRGFSSHNGMEANMESGDATVCKTAIYIGNLNHKSVLDSIERAGKKEGWRMTEFKANAIIAEKMIGSETYATTITVAKEHIMCNKNKLPQSDLDALRSAIVDELQKDSKKH